MTLREEIEARLRATMDVEAFQLHDDSEAHRGHAGAASGGGHFDLMLVSTGFEGLSRHQLVYDALSDLLPKQIHALSIDARSPSEVK
jgi:BolA family transcriptional regulator, general stress-responsive regulator